MTYAQTILPEFKEEMATTRRVLERVPEDRLDWKPHPKSNTIGWNACHLAELPGWVAPTLAHASWDIAPPGEEPYRTPALTSRAAILELFDRNVAAAVAALEKATDAQMAESWSLLGGGEVYFTCPRSEVIRKWVISHGIHHRAILSVSYRLNDIPVPAIYGPSGDEQG